MQRNDYLTMITMQDNLIHSVADFVKDVTISSNPEYCSKTVKLILSTTGHVPVAYNVARGAGFCSYFARMVEVIGVKESFTLRISGKGSEIHRILGIASINVFKDGVLPPPEHYIDEAIEDAIKTLEISDEKSVSIARLLLKNLIDNLNRFLNLIKSNNTPFIPIAEQQLIDYKVHIRGVPDLILENREQRKSIVVEWKTSPESVSEWEGAQVLAYALLAGRRFGFSPEEAMDAILGKYNESTNEFEELHILPVIIRPSTNPKVRIKPHPALWGLTGEDLIKELEKFKKLLFNVKLEAEHLTVLNFNTRRLSPGESKFISEKCLAKTRSEHKVNSLRLTPYQLPRGKPREQSKYPCIACNEGIRMACKYYYGSGFNVRDSFDKTMWGLRFKVYDKLESLLLEYKAIYDIFAEKGNLIREIIEEGKGLEYNSMGSYATINERVSPCSIEIIDKKRNISKVKIDITEKVIDVNTNNYTLTARRKLRGYERDGIPSTLRDGKPCMLVFLENDIPFLSINLFCRVDEVDVYEDFVDYILGIPSSAFRYQFLLLKKYFETQMFKDVPIILLQVDANLLHLELRTIDLLQRTFDEDYKKIELKHKDVIMEQLKNNRKSYESAYFEDDSMLISQLREIIRRGHVTRNKDGASSR